MGWAELTGTACNPRLDLVEYVAKNQDIHHDTNTIQSYFYFRYINANDNLLFIIHQYHFLSFSHHWELFHNQMEKEALRWEIGGVKVKYLGDNDFESQIFCFNGGVFHFQITSGRQSSMSLEWKAKINLWRKTKLCCSCLNLLMGHSHEFLHWVWQKQKLGLKLKPKCWIFFAGERGGKGAEENNLNQGWQVEQKVLSCFFWGVALGLGISVCELLTWGSCRRPMW